MSSLHLCIKHQETKPQPNTDKDLSLSLDIYSYKDIMIKQAVRWVRVGSKGEQGGRNQGGVNQGEEVGVVYYACLRGWLWKVAVAPVVARLILAADTLRSGMTTRLQVCETASTYLMPTPTWEAIPCDFPNTCLLPFSTHILLCCALSSSNLFV